MGRPPKNAFAEDTETRVLRAAEEAFGEHGYRKTRLSDIAAVAGIRRSSLLYHFQSKARLYALVVERAFAELRETVALAVAAGGEPAAALDRLVGALTGFASRRQPLVSIVLRELVDPTGDLVAEEFSGLIRNLEMAWQGMAGSAVETSYPLRPAILQLVSAYLLRTAAGELGETLWGPEDHTPALARRLLLAQQAKG